ncbi:Alcohol dehydrogenase superfamily zinc-containing [Botryosphaeria dothidea]|uniref:Alcohol dehydrogenase superfamily zinc-containing n=1 Tax=Botryosphaeria dothidea TaxID=55169 RepID=A0A8H4NBP3_9PEZI|nr:Alcohol dehydrogenase superfamily zinc-containing [Botryosphaeria dothidea]
MAAPEIPKKYKAVIYDKPGTLSTKVVELDTPEPGPGEVLINFWSQLPFPTPEGQVGGHEGVGTIVKMGPGSEAAAVKVGERVGIKWLSGICGSCTCCLAGMDGQCKNQVGCPLTQTHASADRGVITHIPPQVPDGLDSAAAAPMLCAGVTTYSALRKAGAQSGDYVVLLGAGGGLGHIAAQLGSRGMGYRIIGVDSPSKEDLVRGSGAEHFLPHTLGKDLPGRIKDLTDGLGASAVIVLTAANSAYAQAVELLREGGTLVCVGIPEGAAVPIAGAMPQFLVAKALKIVGVAVGDRREAIETMDFARRGLVTTHYRTAKMDELTDVFRDMEEGRVQGRVVLDLS